MKIWAEDDLDDVEELPVNGVEWYYLAVNFDMSYDRMILAAPASQLFSVKIDCNSIMNDEICEVYGEINIEDEDGVLHEVYCCDRDDAQPLSRKHNILTLSIPEECSASSRWIKMSLRLKNSTDQSVIIDEVCSFDNKVTAEDYYDRIRVREVCGIAGSATVEYTVLSTADLAYVEIALTKDVNSEGDSVPATHLYGRIVARYGNTFGKIFPEILLYEKPSTHPTKAVPNIPTSLCSCVVAVPAYCFLRVDLELYDSYTNQPLVKDKARSLAIHYFNKNVVIRNNDFVVEVDMHWSHPYAYGDQVVNSPLQLSDDEQEVPSLSLSLDRGLFRCKRSYLGFPLAEVFSVVIDTDMDASSGVDIFGTIKVWGFPKGGCVAYNRYPWNVETLSTNNKTISLLGFPECFEAPDGFGMALHLSDLTGQVLINGDVSWSLNSVTGLISWYDRRICAIIRGVHGYAAVFHTIFSRAVQARVEVSLKPKGPFDDSHNFYGSIVARYSTEDYSGDYEQKYYQNVLFNERKENPSKLTPDFIVPLSKSVVAVPVEGSLILKVDLYAKSLVDGSLEEHLNGVEEFDIGDGVCLLSTIEGKKYDIECSVKWSKLYSLAEK